MITEKEIEHQNTLYIRRGQEMFLSPQGPVEVIIIKVLRDDGKWQERHACWPWIRKWATPDQIRASYIGDDLGGRDH